MAITKLLRIKETKGSNRSSHLKNNIFYICNPEKTEGGCWIGGNAGTTPENIYGTMMMNKNYWGKEDGTQGFHYVISFPPDLDIDEMAAYEITSDFCDELLGDNFYYCIAVHNDRDHLHAHITFDSVSKKDGYKFHSPKGDWEKRIQPITDRICKKHEIPVLEYSKEDPAGVDYGAWNDGKEWEGKRKGRNQNGLNQKPISRRQKTQTAEIHEGETEIQEDEIGKRENENPKTGNFKFSWYDIIRDDIDEAIAKSDSYEEFIKNLKEMMYEVKDRKYLSLKPHGKDRFVRSVRLGEQYGKDEIIKRLNGKKAEAEFRRYGKYDAVQEMMDRQRKQEGGATAFQKKFYYRFVCTVNIRHPAFRENWKFKKEVLELHRYNQQISYILSNGIRSREDAELKKQEAQIKIRRIDAERRKMAKEFGTGNYFRIEELLSLQEELKKYPEGSREDLMENVKQLVGEIILSETLEEALERYNGINKLLETMAAGRKAAMEEIKILDGILGEKIPDRDYRKYRKEEQEGSSAGSWRITINRVLFESAPEKEGCRTVRIPGTGVYVALPVKNVMRFSESAISAYVYRDREYDVLDSSEKPMKRISGSELMSHFDDRTKKKGKLGKEGKMK